MEYDTVQQKNLVAIALNQLKLPLGEAAKVIPIVQQLVNAEVKKEEKKKETK